MGDYRGDYTDMAREYYCGAYEEELPTEAKLIRDAMGGDWPALALQALIAEELDRRGRGRQGLPQGVRLRCRARGRERSGREARTGSPPDARSPQVDRAGGGMSEARLYALRRGAAPVATPQDLRAMEVAASSPERNYIDAHVAWAVVAVFVGWMDSWSAARWSGPPRTSAVRCSMTVGG
jgi:hypothetical protein